MGVGLSLFTSLLNIIEQVLVNHDLEVKFIAEAPHHRKLFHLSINRVDNSDNRKNQYSQVDYWEQERQK